MKNKDYKMEQIFFFEVYNNCEGYGHLFARYTTIEKAIKQLKKSEALIFSIKCNHAHTIIGDSIKSELDFVVNNLDLIYNEDLKRIEYKCDLLFLCPERSENSGINEDGFSYVNDYKTQINQETQNQTVQGFLFCEKIFYNLDGIMSYRGAILNDNGYEVEQKGIC